MTRENQTKNDKNSYSSDNKSILESRLFIAIAFTIIGFAIATFTYQIASQRNKDIFIKEISTAKNPDDFIEVVRRNRNLFVNNVDHDLALLEKEAREKLLNFRENVKDSLGENSANAQVSYHEDDKNYFYELNFSGFNKDEIAVKVDKMINFSAKTKSEDKKSSSTSSFDYSFSIPDYDKKVKPEIIKEDKKVIVKLAKKTS